MDNIMLIDENFVEFDLVNHRGQKYPRIVVDPSDIIKPSIAPEHLWDVWHEDPNVSFPRRLMQRYHAKGFWSMLKMIENESLNKTRNNIDNDPKIKISLNKIVFQIIYFLAVIILYIRSFYLTILYYFYPFQKFSDDELLKRFNPNPEWKHAVIRSFSWHPTQLRCALALINDFIYIYSADAYRSNCLITHVKHNQQKRITAMIWHPNRLDQLAVACHSGKILVWSIGFKNQDARSVMAMNIEKIEPTYIIDTGLKSPLTSLTFTNSGCLIACSPRNSVLASVDLSTTKSIVEQNYQQKVEIIKKIFPQILPQFTHVSWSPCRTRLLAHPTTTGKIYIFETKTWSFKCWKLPEKNKHCQTSAWAKPSGRFLLFVPTESSKIYALTFYDRAEAGDVGGGPTNQSVLVLDTIHHIPDFEAAIIQHIEWDSKSKRLAVSFKDHEDTVAIYYTQMNPALEILPLLILKSNFKTSIGRCLLFKFHDGYIDDGSLLTLCWSNGFITHVQLKLIEIEQTNNHSEVEQSTILTPFRSLTRLCKTFDNDDSDNTQTRSFDKSIFYKMNGTSTPNDYKNGGLHLNVSNGNTNTHSPQANLVTTRRNQLYSPRLHFD